MCNGYNMPRTSAMKPAASQAHGPELILHGRIDDRQASDPSSIRISLGEANSSTSIWQLLMSRMYRVYLEERARNDAAGGWDEDKL